jgi:carbon storage regulator
LFATHPESFTVVERLLLLGNFPWHLERIPTMLVLSRRLNEKIVLPLLNMIIRVVAVKPGVVRLGIEAPAEVIVLREEVQGRAGTQSDEPITETTHPKRNPFLRNGLNAVAADLELLRSQLQSGRTVAAQATLARMDRAFQVLRRQVQKEQGVPA